VCRTSVINPRTCVRLGLEDRPVFFLHSSLSHGCPIIPDYPSTGRPNGIRRRTLNLELGHCEVDLLLVERPKAYSTAYRYSNRLLDLGGFRTDLDVLRKSRVFLQTSTDVDECSGRRWQSPQTLCFLDKARAHTIKRLQCRLSYAVLRCSGLIRLVYCARAAQIVSHPPHVSWTERRSCWQS
jgi:hypothetical protein